MTAWCSDVNWMFVVFNWRQNTMELLGIWLGEAHRSKYALYDAKPPILVSQQLSHNETIQSYNVYIRRFIYGHTFVCICECGCCCSLNGRMCDTREREREEKRKKKKLKTTLGYTLVCDSILYEPDVCYAQPVQCIFMWFDSSLYLCVHLDTRGFARHQHQYTFNGSNSSHRTTYTFDRMLFASHIVIKRIRFGLSYEQKWSLKKKKKK